MTENAVSHAVIAGAGSAGLTWEPASRLLPLHVFAVPDRPSVPEMAADLAPEIARLPAPRLLTGYALGAMVAIEVQKLVSVQGLVLISAGFGITVAESLLDYIETNPPQLLEKTARRSLADGGTPEQLALAVRDFEARGHLVLLNHLRALGAYRPQEPQSPPPTLVVWGERDRSVPLASHLELAQRYRGALAPVAGAAHKPYLEQPEVTMEWLRRAAAWSLA